MQSSCDSRHYMRKPPKKPVTFYQRMFDTIRKIERSYTFMLEAKRHRQICELFPSNPSRSMPKPSEEKDQRMNDGGVGDAPRQHISSPDTISGNRCSRSELGRQPKRRRPSAEARRWAQRRHDPPKSGRPGLRFGGTSNRNTSRFRLHSAAIVARIRPAQFAGIGP